MAGISVILYTENYEVEQRVQRKKDMSTSGTKSWYCSIVEGLDLAVL